MEKRSSVPEPVVVRFKGQDCLLALRRYRDNGRVGLELIGKHSGESIAVATVNAWSGEWGKDEVLIKDYSENHGMLRALCEAKVVRPTGETIPSGYVELPKCKLLVEVPDNFIEGTIVRRPLNRTLTQRKDERSGPTILP
ncbi:MAG: hypothetical protein ACTHN5_12470 [Phycisphaerae bacterium]